MARSRTSRAPYICLETSKTTCGSVSFRVRPTEWKLEGCWATVITSFLLISVGWGPFPPPVSYVVTSLVGKTLLMFMALADSNKNSLVASCVINLIFVVSPVLVHGAPGQKQMRNCQ